MKNSLRSQAKKVVVTTAKATDTKKNTILEGVDADELRQKIVAAKLGAIITGWEKSSTEKLKPVATKVWLEDTKKTGISAESMIFSAVEDKKSTRVAELKTALANAIDEVMKVDDVSVLFGVMDKYIQAGLDDDRVAYLHSIFGNEITTAKEEFLINNEMVDEHGETLMKFILGWEKAFEVDEEKFLIDEKTGNEKTGKDLEKSKKELEKAQKEATAKSAAYAKIMADHVKAINENPLFSNSEKEVLLMLIEPKFSDKVKSELIQYKSKHSISKGAINNLKKFADNATKICGSDWTVEQVVAEIQPISFFKARGKGDK